MKNIILIFLTACFYLNGLSQETENRKTNNLLKELAANGCKCVDSINTINKSKEIILNEISKCIDTQTFAYQMGVKLIDIDLQNVKDKSVKQIVNINLITDKNSKEYKVSYYKMESYMMNNCTSLINKIDASDIEDKKSYSKNPEAQILYSKGLKESEKGKYKTAISYFEKALKIDSVFAFAWDNIGICNRMLKNYDEAIYDYNRSLMLDPKGIVPLQNLAVDYRFKKEYYNAISAYNKLAELDENNPEVYFGIGETYSLYLKEHEKGLDNMCRAYTIYQEQKSPYSLDAEKIIVIIYTEMKKLGKQDRFYEILEKYNITLNLN
jgi:tetratricopeptide (TPR) repeat protein